MLLRIFNPLQIKNSTDNEPTEYLKLKFLQFVFIINAYGMSHRNYEQ